MTSNIFDYTPEELADMPRADALRVLTRNGTWLDAQDFPPIRWAVPGLIPEGFGLITGPPKLGKSWFILDVLLAVASGGRALGRISVPQRPVLYFALEDSERRMQSRIRVLLGRVEADERFEFICDTRAQPVEPLVDAWLEEHPDGVVALDTLGKVMPCARAGEGAYERDYRIGGALKRLTDERPGSTLAVVHHVRKQGSTDWMDSTSGTNGLNGSADWTLNLERLRGEGGAVIRITGRDVEEGEYAASLTGGRWELAADTLNEAAQIAHMGRKREGLGENAQSVAVLDYVAQHPDGVRARDVAEALGMSEKNAGAYLSRLYAAERIERPERGLYAPQPNNPTLSTGTQGPPFQQSNAPAGAVRQCEVHEIPLHQGRCQACRAENQQ